MLPSSSCINEVQLPLFEVDSRTIVIDLNPVKVCIRGIVANFTDNDGPALEEAVTLSKVFSHTLWTQTAVTGDRQQACSHVLQDACPMNLHAVPSPKVVVIFIRLGRIGILKISFPIHGNEIGETFTNDLTCSRIVV